MPTILTPEQLRARFSGTRKSLSWYDSVLLYHRLKVHADGEVPTYLIKKARPNESEEVREYREAIYEAETQNPISRVIGVLEKIRRSPDWVIRFKGEVPAIISDDETLEKYITENYPVYKSLENWLFEEALKALALDANAICVVMPERFEVNSMEYIKPVAKIFNSPAIIDYVQGDYIIVKSDEYSSLLPSDIQQSRAAAMAGVSGNPLSDSRFGSRIDLPYTTTAMVFYLINNFVYQKWEETKDGKYQLTKEFAHNLNALPAFQVPGKFHKRMGDNVIKKTPLNPMVHHLNKAARESNDLDIGVIRHLYLEKWTIDNNVCPECQGNGKVISAGKTSTCNSCKGDGLPRRSGPVHDIIIKPSAIGQQAMPTPPMGYVNKDVKIIEIQNERVKEHIQRALEAINMEHLGETPLAQSGIAKSYDRDEVNNLIYFFAEMLVYFGETSIYWMNELRYKDIIPDQVKRAEMRPSIPVPEKFDVINTTFLLGEYSTAKTAGLNGIILAQMQREIASKKFYSDPDVAKFVNTVMSCDPFPDKTIEEKCLIQAQGLATKEDVVLSNYISDFISQAMEQDKTFLDKKPMEKRAILMKFAEEKVKSLNDAAKMAQEVIMGGNSDAPPAKDTKKEQGTANQN